MAKDQKMAVVSYRFLEIHVRYLLKCRATIPLLHDWEMEMHKQI